MRVQNIVVGSFSLWHDAVVLGIHALTQHMLDKGCRIEWFTIPLSLLHLVKPKTIRARRAWLHRWLEGPLREDEGRGYLVNRIPFTPVHPVPNIPLLESLFLSRSYLSLRIPSLMQLARQDGVNPVDMVFFDPGGVSLCYPFEGKARSCVYRMADCLAEFPGQPRGQIESEREMLRKADLILPVSPPLYEIAVAARGSSKGVHLLRNGVDLDLFQRPHACPPEYARVPEPRALFIGTMTSWFDWDLFLGIARLRPQVSFCLIGRGQVPRVLPPNVYYLGPRSHELVPGYMQHASVGLITYKNLIRVHRAERPLKFYEYIASGLPVVSVPYGHLTQMAPHALFGKTAGEFAEAIDHALTLTSSKKEELKQVAESFSWSSIYHQFDDILLQEGLILG